VGINYGSVYRWIAGNGLKDRLELAKLDKKREESEAQDNKVYFEPYIKQAQGLFVDGKGNERYRIGQVVFTREKLLSRARTYNIEVNSDWSLEELGDAVLVGQKAYYDEVDSINEKKNR
jgi:hypothetical protein